MKQKPILAAVCGLKNSGKTSLIERLLAGFAKRGLRVAVIKHDGHDFTCDVPGTDTDRFSKAGAYGCAAFSKNRCFVHRQGTKESEKELIALFPEADVILIEGLKDSALRKLELVKSTVSDHPVSNPEGRFLVVTDLAGGIPGERSVSFEETDRIIEAILGEEPMKEEGEEMNGQLSHFDEKGQAIMVDVTDKARTDRTAVARGRIRVGEPTLQAILSGNASKGDVLSVARIAGIMAVKKTSDLIPLCHPLPLGKCRIDFQIDEKACEVESVCTVSLHGQTGVEMEALTGVSVSLLTIYDMCKAIDKRMEITGIHLASKSGGKSGDFVYEPAPQKGPSRD